MQRRLRMADRSGPLPRLERPHFPIALLLLAGFSLQPSLRAARDKARQEIAAGLTILCVRGGDRGHGATRTGTRIFPRHAGVLLAAAEHCADCSSRISEVSSGRQLSGLLCPGWWHDRSSVVGLFAEQRIELTRKATTAAAKRQ